ncbi:MAG: thiamine diphosphokinase [Desulfomonilia bacterium]|nr:thiamine diphosphokinase [Desulfomonilia bacterium]
MFLIVSGGYPPDADFLAHKARDARMIIAADRGARYCLEAGVTPHLLVGDMDSLSPHELHEISGTGIEVIRFSPEKDATDTHIALDEAIKRGANAIEIIAATGSRFDHALANVHLLYRAYLAGIPARIVDQCQEIVLLAGTESFEDREGATVSLLPLTAQVEEITLKGFSYELSGARMEIGNPYGVSNVITARKATVTIGKGILVAVLVTGEDS